MSRTISVKIAMNLGLGLLVANVVAGVCLAAETGRVIHLAIEADEAMNAVEVARKFDTARNSTTDFNYANIDVAPIEAESYQLLDSLVRRGLLAAGEQSAGETGIVIEPVRGDPGVWEINLGSPDRFLDTTSIVYQTDDGVEKSEDLGEPVGRDRPDARLRYHSPGCYILKLEKNVSPRAISLRLSDDAGNISEETVGWPRVGRCYLVTLTGVVGDERRLFASLQDKRKVGDPIKQLFPSTSTLIVGSFREKDPWVRPGYVSLRYPMPAGRAPARLWLRFPLTQAEEKAVWNLLDGQLKPANGFIQLPAWLKNRKLPDGERLTPGSDKWIEVPFDPGQNAFVIDVPIDTRAWQQFFQKNPDKVGDRAVLAWEWQDPVNSQDREILRIGGPGGKRYQTDRIGWWLQGLPTAPLPEK
jgi:hypothetical protein